MPEELKFDYQQALVGRDGEVDHDNAVIRGASLIKTGEAEGHGLVVDQTLLSQLQTCGKEKGKVSINLDHGSGITSTCGYVTGFRIDGEKLRGDIHLLKSHKETPVILERAEKMPECFGLSVAFRPPSGNKKGDPIGQGKFAARCDKLMSVDLVCRPAANDSLFSIPSVDKSRKSMAKAKSTIKLAEEDEPTLGDVIQAIGELSGRLDQQDQFNSDVIAHLQGGGREQEPDPNAEGPTLQDLVDMPDEELQRLGLTRDDVNAAVQEVMAGMEGEQTGGEPQGGEHTATYPGVAPSSGMVPGGGGGVESGIATEAAGGTGGATALASLKREIMQMKAEQRLIRLNEKKEAEEIEFAQIEQKILVLAEQRDRAIELAESAMAEVEALRVAVKTGTRPVAAGVDNGIRMFGANGDGGLHVFQTRVKQLEAEGKTPGEAVMLAQKEDPAAHADWVRNLNPKTVQS